jgi:hypothetical protein
MGVCYLVGAGDFFTDININAGDIIIAADGGYDSLVSRGYVPSILIGDFDSITSAIPNGITTVKHPKEKDETDMFLAYLEGVRLGYTEFVMLGATGGRLDHTYANLALLLYAKEMYDLTEGLTNVAMGSVLSIWHDYRQDGMDEPWNAELPPMDKLAAANEHVNIDALVIDEKNNTVTLEDDVTGENPNVRLLDEDEKKELV